MPFIGKGSARLIEADIAPKVAKSASEAGSVAVEMDYKWKIVKEERPTPFRLIVWVSAGGGSALLARFDRDAGWENATSDKPLPFYPVFWQHLKLPDPPPNANGDSCGK